VWVGSEAPAEPLCRCVHVLRGSAGASPLPGYAASICEELDSELNPSFLWSMALAQQTACAGRAGILNCQCSCDLSLVSLFAARESGLGRRTEPGRTDAAHSAEDDREALQSFQTPARVSLELVAADPKFHSADRILCSRSGRNG